MNRHLCPMQRLSQMLRGRPQQHEHDHRAEVSPAKDRNRNQDQQGPPRQVLDRQHNQGDHDDQDDLPPTHAYTVSAVRAEKTVLFSTRTLSTMPMMVASMGSFSVSGVSRALEPCTISTVSPSPAPTVS